jgi:hypothetical protein
MKLTPATSRCAIALRSPRYSFNYARVMQEIYLDTNHWIERKTEIEIIEKSLNKPQNCTVGIRESRTVGIQGLGGIGKRISFALQ